MNEKTDDLIAEARLLIADCQTYNFGLYNADKLAHQVAPKLADTLEAATSERDAALAAIEQVRALHDFDNGYCTRCEIPFHECEVAMELSTLAPVTEEGVEG